MKQRVKSLFGEPKADGYDVPSGASYGTLHILKYNLYPYEKVLKSKATDPKNITGPSTYITRPVNNRRPPFHA